MPSAPKPKKFVAAVPFTYRRRTYQVGEPVDDRRTVDRLVGTRFIAVKRSKSASAETPTAESEEG